MQVDRSVGPVSTFTPGYKAAIRTLDDFCNKRIRLFGSKRNDPTINALSNLSPYFHFGKHFFIQFHPACCIHLIILLNRFETVITVTEFMKVWGPLLNFECTISDELNFVYTSEKKCLLVEFNFVSCLKLLIVSLKSHVNLEILKISAKTRDFYHYQ